MKLEIELIPRTSYFDNVRSAVPTREWDQIRTAAYARYNHACGICGKNPKRLEAHEIWEFDEAKRTQKLVGIIALCTLCHRVKHLGLTEMLALQGKVSIQAVLTHFCRVNKCSKEEFLRHREEKFLEWEVRSHGPWQVDISWLESNAGTTTN